MIAISMLAELVAIAVVLLAAGAELMHGRRCRRLAPLAFGPGEKPSWWTRMAGPLRVIAMGGMAWALVTLMLVSPKIYKAASVDEGELRHIVLVLDVSPSMKLADAGPEKSQSRSKRVYGLMESFFKRVSMDQFRLSLIAVYNGAKPVVVDTKDVDVVRNFLDGLDMYQAFEPGQTTLFAGLEEAAKIAEPWKMKSTTIVVVSDGDTVPATGMPKMPASVGGVLVVGVGDPKTGSFIDGRQSRQDVSTLRQIALRLGGEYFDGNEKHLPTETLLELTDVTNENPFEKLTRREYALATAGLSGVMLALLPLALSLWGTRWRPGVPVPGRRVAES